MTTTVPYGSWKSPISAADTIAGVVGFAEPVLDGDDLYWLEMRPGEQGRQVLVRRSADGAITDLTPPPTNVRTRVHEYGGGAFAVSNGTVVYSDFADQRLYRADGDGEATAITPLPPRPMSLRYADIEFLSDGQLVCVRESHPEVGEAVSELVVVSMDDGDVTVVASGRSFYASPRVSPDGSQLAWLEWDHPNMPWDGSELMVATIGDASLAGALVAGGRTESIAEPCWAPDGTLIYMSDRTGWWNPYRYDGTQSSAIVTRNVEFANPAWVFRYTSYGFLSGDRVLAAYWDRGRHVLAVIESDGRVDDLGLDFSRYSAVITDNNSRAWAVVHHPHRPSALVEIDVESATASIVRSNPEPVADTYLTEPRLISFPTAGGDVAHGVYYPPTNPEFEAPNGELPPLIVEVHGGPTACVFPRLSVAYMFWTSRGFGVVDVNYRGSTGYGRDFRRKLEGEWGVVDVDDCLAAAQHLAAAGDVDPDRLVITGGSAGGYTTLAALAFRDGFSGGASYFGVADLELFATHTHKFESRYLDRLVHPDDFRARSPIHSVDQIDRPVVLFQGLDDRVVPPAQAQVIADALRDRGVPFAHIEYEGEDHGFRKSENIIHSLETELAFYGEVLGFTPAGDLPHVPLVRPA
jgi:dipeptidyl aminopeptidase/acylaminoacyl peptidase